MHGILSSSPTMRTYSSVSKKTYGGKRSSRTREKSHPNVKIDTNGNGRILIFVFSTLLEHSKHVL